VDNGLIHLRTSESAVLRPTTAAHQPSGRYSTESTSVSTSLPQLPNIYTADASTRPYQRRTPTDTSASAHQRSQVNRPIHLYTLVQTARLTANPLPIHLQGLADNPPIHSPYTRWRSQITHWSTPHKISKPRYVPACQNTGVEIQPVFQSYSRKIKWPTRTGWFEII